MDILPDEMLEAIFSQTILFGFFGILRQVCRRWRDVIGVDKKYTYYRHLAQSESLLGFYEKKLSISTLYRVRLAAARYSSFRIWSSLVEKTKSYTAEKDRDAGEAAKGNRMGILICITSGLRKTSHFYTIHEEAYRGAAFGGNINVLDYLTDIAPLEKYAESVFNGATANGHIHVLKWMIEKIPDFDFSPMSFFFAVVNNHIEVIDWAIQNTHWIPTKDIFLLSLGGNVGTVKYLYDMLSEKIDKSKPEYVCYASSNSNEEVLEWLHQKEFVSPERNFF